MSKSKGRALNEPNEPNELEEINELNDISLTRRRFLAASAVTTAGASVAALQSTTGYTASATQKATSQENCPGANAPLREVKDKIAFITGGASGIGFGMARAFVDA